MSFRIRPILAMLIATAMTLCASSALVAETTGRTVPETVILAAGLLDPASGTLTRNVRIVVRDRRIAAIEPQKGGEPVGKDVIDYRQSIVMPGLMDTHVHLGLATIPEEKQPESDAWIVMRAQRLAGEMLRAGFTTVRDLGNERNYLLTDLRRAIDQGWIVGPTIINAGRVIAPFGGQSGRSFPVPSAEGPTWLKEYTDSDGPQAIVRAVRENIYYGAQVIKLVADQKPYYYSETEVRAAVDEAHRAGRKVAVHVAGGPAARNVINAGADSIEHGFDLTTQDLELMRERGTYLSTTDFAYPQLLIIFRGNEPIARSWADRIRNRLERADKIGVKLAFGTDAIWVDPKRTRGEVMIDFIEAYKAAGVSNLKTVQAMTVNAAQLLGVAADRGRLTVGTYADLVIVPSNPLQDLDALRTPLLVMKEGAVVFERDAAIQAARSSAVR